MSLNKLNNLPADILREIGLYLPIRKVVKLRKTCKHINTALSSNQFWINLLDRDFQVDIREFNKTCELDYNNANNSYKLLYLKNKDLELLHKYSKGVTGPTGVIGPVGIVGPIGNIGPTNLSITEKVIIWTFTGVFVFVIWNIKNITT